MKYGVINKSLMRGSPKKRIYGEKKGFNRPTPELELDDETDDFQEERSPGGRSIGLEVDEYEYEDCSICG